VIYSIDVSGHGIASALLTARIAAYFSGNSPRQNIALKMGDDGAPVMRPPERVVETLNGLILNELETEHYLTIALAHVNLRTGQTVLVQAGHPHPVLQRANGQIEHIGAGGFPVGLLPDVSFDAFEVQLYPGDRLFLGSDGITECENPAGVMLDQAGLSEVLRKNATLSGEVFFEAMMWDLNQYAGDRDFSDDVSGILLEFKGPDKM
jgi:sigma-B regulation protein RsbU (phosphoserine phosphatase)